MTLALYMDHHVPRTITVGLRLREVDVITSLEDATNELDDPALLERATKLGRVLFTQDDDLLAEASRRQKAGIPFEGVIYAHQLYVSIGSCIDDLEIIVKTSEMDELRNLVVYLPL